MAYRRISELISRSSSSVAPDFRLIQGKSFRWNNTIKGFSTMVVDEEPIMPPVQIRCTQLLINGQYVGAVSGKTFTTVDPRTGDVIAHVAEGDGEDIDRAVSALCSSNGLQLWTLERSRILWRFADLIEKHNDEIAAIETWDSGKPYEQDSKVEIPMLARLIRYYAGWADKIHGLSVATDGDHHAQVLHEPIGVVGQIIPWNFPLLMYGWKVSPASTCGNTVFAKILNYIKSGIGSCATLEPGGDKFGDKGYYVQPTVFSGVQDHMKIAKEEIFGPVQSILKFKELDEVIRRANASKYGLAAGVFTNDRDTANTLIRAFRVGSVRINCCDIFYAAIPFGGYKMSGQGKEKGMRGLKNYLQVKSVVTPLKNPTWL